MTREEMLACLNDRPCDVCKFHTENGCARWSCVFEEEPDSEQAEVQAYFDGESFGWDEGRKALIEDIKAEIKPEIKKALGDYPTEVIGSII